MDAAMNPDPLCLAHVLPERRDPHIVCTCRALRTARLQGPVKTNRHAPLCWCARCLAASDEIHGTRGGAA